MSARTRNAYLQTARGFCKWFVHSERLTTNPLIRIAKVDEKCDRRRQRRSMTEAELVALLQVARMRPLAEFGRESVSVDDDESEANGKRSSWMKTELTLDTMQAVAERARERLANNPEFVEKLERLGMDRALIYKTLVLTGLRRGELASLTVAQLELDGPMPFVVLNAADEKNRQGSIVPLRRDLANDLKRDLAVWHTEAAYDSPAQRQGHLGQQATAVHSSEGTRSHPLIGTCKPLASPSGTSGDEPSTFTPCELHLERY